MRALSKPHNRAAAPSLGHLAPAGCRASTALSPQHSAPSAGARAHAGAGMGHQPSMWPSSASHWLPTSLPGPFHNSLPLMQLLNSLQVCPPPLIHLFSVSLAFNIHQAEQNTLHLLPWPFHQSQKDSTQPRCCTPCRELPLSRTALHFRHCCSS